MPEKYCIQSLEVEGFRGINEKKRFDFDRPFIFLFGKNGVGKSSVLGAIEWCFFGDLEYVRMESRTKDELINSFNLDGECKVKIVLKCGNETCSLSREKELGSRDTHLTLECLQGKFEDEEAQNRCSALFNLSFDDFYRAVYLHQESIRGLLIDDPKERDEAMDRLFGLERMRDIIESVPLRDIADLIGDLQVKKDKIEEKTKGAIIQYESDLKKLEKEAEELNLNKDKQTLEYGKKISGKLITDINTIARQHNLGLSEINPPTETKELNTVANKIKSNLNECRKKVAEVSELPKLTKRKTDLGSYSERLSENKVELTRCEEDKKKIIEEFGDQETILSKNKKIDEEVNKFGDLRKSTNVKFRLLEDAIECLESTKNEVCPVCNSEIDRKKLVKKLKSEVKETQQKEIKQIDTSVKKLKEEKEINEDKLNELDRINKKVDELSKLKKKILSSIGDVLQKEVMNEEDIDTAIINEIKKLEIDITKLTNVYGQREEEFQKIENEIEKLRIVYKVIKKREEFNEIKVVSPEEDKETGTLQEGVDKLGLFKKQLEGIIESMTKIQIDLATEMIDKSSANIKKTYTKLCGHPYYDNLQINVKSRNVKGYVKNSYLLRAFNSSENKDTLVSTRFSTGQMNCVALSVYLSLSKVLPHRLGFLILDDPSQNLDTEHKEALCSILKEIKTDSQIIIASQDNELEKMLCNIVSVDKDKHVYTFSGWDKRKGPAVNLS